MGSIIAAAIHSFVGSFFLYFCNHPCEHNIFGVFGLYCSRVNKGNKKEIEKDLESTISGLLVELRSI